MDELIAQAVKAMCRLGTYEVMNHLTFAPPQIPWDIFLDFGGVEGGACLLVPHL